MMYNYALFIAPSSVIIFGWLLHFLTYRNIVDLGNTGKYISIIGAVYLSLSVLLHIVKNIWM